MSTFLLWCDLETTGLVPTSDEIIEAAFILTDSELHELGRKQTVIQPSPAGWARLVGNREVLRMHIANGLVSELAEANLPQLAVVTDVVLDMIETATQNPYGATIHLAGSGIAAFDRPMIREHMPELDGMLHYAPIDVGVLKRCWKMWTGSEITPDNEAKNHRAMSDVEGHLGEARAFRYMFGRLA